MAICLQCSPTQAGGTEEEENLEVPHSQSETERGLCPDICAQTDQSNDQ